MNTAAAADGEASPKPIKPSGHIRLYIAGATPNSLRARTNLQAAMNMLAKMATPPNVEIIDVFEGPKRAIADGILVTPTLVAQFPDRRVMMVGDLSDAAALGSILEPRLTEARGD